MVVHELNMLPHEMQHLMTYDRVVDAEKYLRSIGRLSDAEIDVTLGVWFTN